MPSHVHVHFLFFFLIIPRPPSSTLFPYTTLFRSVNAGNGGFLRCIQMDTSVNAANQVVSVGADIAFDRSEGGSAGMPRPISYAVFCLKKKKNDAGYSQQLQNVV